MPAATGGFLRRGNRLHRLGRNGQARAAEQVLRLSIRIIGCLALLALPLGSAAAATDSGPAFIVVDADAGTVLNESRSDHLWYPASITKLMTAYIVFSDLKAGTLKMTSPVKVSAHALAQAPAKMGFKVGTVMNVDNALKMMLVKSANDIAMALAETIGGNEAGFVALMNAEARTLGMASTHFDNPNGLPDPQHVTTARDIAVLARAVWTDFPEYRSYLGIPAIKAGKRILRSENKLLEQYPGTNGMKTGFICASGYNMVASARRGGRTMIAVVLGATSSKERNETAAHLLDQGFATWANANKPDLAAFETAPATGAPADLHNAVCEKHVASDDEDEETNGGDVAQSSALGPRFVLMDPVQVFTGRADPLPGEEPKIVKTAAAGGMPMPRLRPRGLDAAAAYAPEPMVLSPTAIQAK
jgi:D-alanyl-D-alanine carboxypeptidase